MFHVMKGILIYLLPFGLLAQPPVMSEKTKFDVYNIQRNVHTMLDQDSAMWERYPIMQIGETYYLSFIGKIRENNDVVVASVPSGILIGQGLGKIRSVRIPLSMLDSIQTLGTVIENLELATKIVPHLDKVRYDTRTDSVYQGNDLPQIYTGKNVLIGMQDWGYDYTHPMFYDTLLQHTRIVAAWDQFKKSGTAPTNFPYGTQYDEETQIIAAQGDTSNQLRYATHATHVAGIAGGSGAGKIAMGMAPEVQFLFTTILVDEAAALDSWEWMCQKAKQMQKNLIVNMSWGLYHFGTNDGTSLMSQALSEYTENGVLFVTSAGNNGNRKFHLQHTFNSDSLFARIGFYDYNLHDSMWGQSIHAWGEVGNDFELKFQIRHLNGTVLDAIDYFSTTNNSSKDSFLVINTNDTVWYNIVLQHAHPQNNRPTARLRVRNKHTFAMVELVARATLGTVHFWNLVELTTNGGNWGLPFRSIVDNSVISDDLYGIGEPACTHEILSVAAHQSEYLSANATSVNGGQRASFSSIGPLYNQVMKPDISAPGQQVLSAISSFTTEGHSNATFTEFNGKTYYFDRLSGTSMSSPVVAGICALIWEANPYLSPQQIKGIVMETARTDQHTGEIPTEGSTQWGRGKINAKEAIKKALSKIGLGENITNHQHKWNVYPNPSTNIVSVSGLENIQSVQLITLDGKVIPLDEKLTNWNLQNQAKGVYLLRIQANNIIYQKKITKL